MNVSLLQAVRLTVITPISGTSLQWSRMSVIASGITGNSTVCSTIDRHLVIVVSQPFDGKYHSISYHASSYGCYEMNAKLKSVAFLLTYKHTTLLLYCVYHVFFQQKYLPETCYIDLPHFSEDDINEVLAKWLQVRMASLSHKRSKG